MSADFLDAVTVVPGEPVVVLDRSAVDPRRIDCPACHARAGISCRNVAMREHCDTHPARVVASLALDLGADRDTRPPRPCCKRIRSAAGSAQWCGLPDPHPGQDCHGLGPSEMLPPDFGPRRKR